MSNNYLSYFSETYNGQSTSDSNDDHSAGDGRRTTEISIGRGS